MRLTLAAVLLLSLTSCSTEQQASHTGPPRTTAYDVPQVVHDFTPEQTTTTTTTTVVIVPATTAPAVEVTVTEVVPLEASEPVRAVGECGGWGDIVVQHFGAEAGTACRVIACETGHTFDPTIENPRSTASGLAQFLDSTWVKARAMVGAEQYARASHAPGAVQIAAMAAWKNATSWQQWECY